MPYEDQLEDNLQAFLQHWGPIDWRARVRRVAAIPDEPTARMLAGLAGIEDDAFYMQRKLRYSGSARLDAVRQFNAVWLAEEADHGRALAALAARYSCAPDPLAGTHHGTFRRDRRSIVAVPVMFLLRPYDTGMLGAYLVLGTLVEYVAVTTYNALADRIGDPAAAGILKDMSRQEGRHMRFYRRGAVAVLAGSPAARLFVRSVVRRVWRPPGVDLYGHDRWVHIFEPLLRDPTTHGLYARMDDICNDLPGLSGLRPMRTFLERCTATLAAGGAIPIRSLDQQPSA